MNTKPILDFLAAECLEIHELLDGALVPRVTEDDEPLSMAQRVSFLTGSYVALIQTRKLITKCASSESPMSS